ncbi:MAG: hypothetical protein DVB23_000759 [Verrucomicrobia bacterium]|jgi:hypothetical protein|nr:MAG: hypothetical protein DVB23_000759 [Verrucomicrobiota bacterium]
MSGFPGDFSEDVGELEDSVQAGISLAEERKGRPLTALEQQWVRLCYTDSDAFDQFLLDHPEMRDWSF